MLNKMTLKTQFIGVIAIPCIALILISLTALQGLSGMQDQTKKLAENTSAPLRSMAEVASRIPRMRVGIDIIILQEIPTMKDQKGVLTRVTETRAEDIPEMDAALKAARDAQVNPITRAEVQKLIDIFDKVKSDELALCLLRWKAGTWQNRKTFIVINSQLATTLCERVPMLFLTRYYNRATPAS